MLGMWWFASVHWQWHDSMFSLRGEAGLGSIMMPQISLSPFGPHPLVFVGATIVLLCILSLYHVLWITGIWKLLANETNWEGHSWAQAREQFQRGEGSLGSVLVHNSDITAYTYASSLSGNSSIFMVKAVSMCSGIYYMDRKWWRASGERVQPERCLPCIE